MSFQPCRQALAASTNCHFDLREKSLTTNGAHRDRTARSGLFPVGEAALPAGRQGNGGQGPRCRGAILRSRFPLSQYARDFSRCLPAGRQARNDKLSSVVSPDVPAGGAVSSQWERQAGPPMAGEPVRVREASKICHSESQRGIPHDQRHALRSGTATGPLFPFALSVFSVPSVVSPRLPAGRQAPLRQPPDQSSKPARNPSRIACVAHRGATQSPTAMTRGWARRSVW